MRESLLVKSTSGVPANIVEFSTPTIHKRIKIVACNMELGA